MTLAEAITWLQKIAAKHGVDVPIYFDCPKCEAAFTPTHLSAVAVHVGTTEKALETPIARWPHSYDQNGICVRCGASCHHSSNVSDECPKETR